MQSTVHSCAADQQQQLELVLTVRRERVATRDLVTIGQRWQRRNDKSLWRVWQVHRADRLVELVPADGDRRCVRTFVRFVDLRSRYSLIRGSGR